MLPPSLIKWSWNRLIVIWCYNILELWFSLRWGFLIYHFDLSSFYSIAKIFVWENAICYRADS